MMEKRVKNSLYNTEFLREGYYPEANAYYYREWDGFCMRFHGHDAVEIMYDISGECVVETQDERIHMKKGSFIMLDAGLPHRLEVAEGKPCRMLNVEFIFRRDNYPLPDLITMAGNSKPLSELLSSMKPYIFLRDNDEIYETLKSLVLEIDRQDSDRLLAQSLFMQLLFRIARIYAESLEKGETSASAYVRKAVEFIHSHYDDEISIDDIASYIGLNRSYLQRIFRSEKNTAINAYMTKIRLDNAKPLLTDTDIHIGDIPGYVGIGSRQHFTWLFKKHTGMSPALYRKKMLRHVRIKKE